MTIKFSVWLHVEEYDDENDTYCECENLDIGSSGTFDTEQEAIDFAYQLHGMAQEWILNDAIYRKQQNPI
jgi:hypothetical protein